MKLQIMNCGNGSFWVTDIGAWVTVHNRFGRYAMSQLYDTESEATLVREWLEEREAGYPPNRVLVDEPQF